LEAKLRQDGVRWDTFTLKPSASNLARGRLRTVRGQLYYKLSSLLRSRVIGGGKFAEVLFGDDAEADAYVYSLYADLCAGRVAFSVLERVMELSRLYDDER